MNIKRVLFLTYGAAGLGIAVFTAVMTYLIIGAPIGYYMFSKILLTVLLTVPVIWAFSRMTGNYFAKKIGIVKERLHTVMEEREPGKLSATESVHEFAAIHHDIETLHRRLQRSMGSLKEKNRSQTYMMRSLAHDMNTPLTIIRGYLEELEDGLHRDEQLPETLRVIRKETEYLEELSSDVVEYLRSMQEGRHQEEIALKPLLEEEVFALLKPVSGVHLQHDVLPGHTIVFNRIDLKKILFNLLHNSCKFTKSGSIGVAYETTTLSVTDSGTGIPPEMRTTLFEPMVSGETAKIRQGGGFGLGLSIASNLASSNGYRLILDDSYAAGTRFLLRPETTKVKHDRGL
jgi:two-component system sensor histidine kinase SaeS